MNAPNNAVAAAMARNASGPSEDVLQQLRAKVKEARELEVTIDDLEERLTQAKASLNKLLMDTLPTMFVAAKTDNVGMVAEGNNPAFDAKLRKYYSAQIPADWDDARKQAAFNMLTERGSGDLIRTIITITVDKEHRNMVSNFLETIPLEFTEEVKESVHKATLTKWLKEIVEKNGTLPNLELINGVVGNKVELKLRKEKK